MTDVHTTAHTPDHTTDAPAPLHAAAWLTQPDVEVLRRALHIANHAAACHVADRCHTVRADDGLIWLDTRPMLDPRECSGAALDLAAEYLGYLELSGVATRHPELPHLVRLTYGRLGRG